MKLPQRKKEISGKGIVILKSVLEAMRAEKVLRGFGYCIRMVAPPPDIRSGCDLAVEFDIIERTGVERTLHKHRIIPLDIIIADDVGLRPLEITREVDFGRHLMVKAGNVKLTFEKARYFFCISSIKTQLKLCSTFYNKYVEFFFDFGTTPPIKYT